MPIEAPISPIGLSRLQELRDAGAVLRYHTARMHRPQTVAEHSYGVAMLVLQVCPTATPALLKAALYHDLAEAYTGDIPAPVKWANPGLADALAPVEGMFHLRMGTQVFLNAQNERILKWADMMELVLWCREEARLGNLYAEEIQLRGMQYLVDMGPVCPLADGMLKELLME